MRDLRRLAIHLIVTFATLLRPGGVRAVAADSLLLKHQMPISDRCRHRTPNLTFLDRFVLGLTTLFISPERVAKLAAILRLASLFKFHKALVALALQHRQAHPPHRIGVVKGVGFSRRAEGFAHAAAVDADQ